MPTTRGRASSRLRRLREPAQRREPPPDEHDDDDDQRDDHGAARAAVCRALPGRFRRRGLGPARSRSRSRDSIAAAGTTDRVDRARRFGGRRGHDAVLGVQRVLLVDLAAWRIRASARPARRPALRASTISKSTAVMLSSPPPRFAARISARGRASRSSRSRARGSPRSRRSSTMSESPSEQRRKTSPGCGRIVNASTSTSGSVPSARVITERCGWTSASAADSSPRRTSSATSEWSSVSCSSRSSRRT